MEILLNGSAVAVCELRRHISFSACWKCHLLCPLDTRVSWDNQQNKTHRGADFFSSSVPLPTPPSPSSSSLCWGITAWTLCMLGKWAIIEPQFLPTCGVDWFVSKCYSEAKDAEEHTFWSHSASQKVLKTVCLYFLLTHTL